MKIVNWLLYFLLLTAVDAGGQTLRRPIASVCTGLGAYSIHHADVFSFTTNQASLAQLKNVSTGVYGERRFLLSELSNYSAVLGLPTASGNFGVKVNFFGFSAFQETQLGFAYGRKLGRKVDVGAQFNYQVLRIAGYGSASAISFEAGTILHVTDRLHAGFHVNNPVGGNFGNTHSGSFREEKLSSVYTLGLGYDASDKFLVSAEIEKEEDQPVNVNAGLQYQFLPKLLARAGISSATSSAWMGFGFMLQSFRIDVTAGYHPQLGITPGLLLLFNLKPPSPKGE